MPKLSDEDLAAAANQGDVETVKLWKQQNPSNSKDPSKVPNGNKLLYTACKHGHLEFTKYMVESCGANPSAAIDGWSTCTAIFAACDHPTPTILEYLITSGTVDVRREDGNGRTVLHHASQKGCVDVVKQLLSLHEMDVNHQDNRGRTAFHLACEEGHFEIVRCLVASGRADLDLQDCYFRTGLAHTVQKRHLDIAKFLIKSVAAEPTPNLNRSRRALCTACKKGWFDIVKEFIEASELYTKFQEIVGMGAFLDAWKKGHWDIMEYLMNSGAVDVNAQDGSGRSILHIVCCHNDVRVMKYLVESHGADISIEDEWGCLPFHNACRSRSKDVMKYFMESCNVDINVQNKNGDTALHLAFKCPDGVSSELVKYLVESCEMDLTIENKDGKTAFGCMDHEPETSDWDFHDAWYWGETYQGFARMFHNMLIRKTRQERETQELAAVQESSHPRGLIERMVSDLTFLAGSGDAQEAIKAKSTVLMIVQPSIKAMIDSGTVHTRTTAEDGTTQHTTIKLPHHLPKHVRCVLQCIYSGDMAFTKDGEMANESDLQGLLLVAEQFGCSELQVAIEEELAKRRGSTGIQRRGSSE
eukprot:CAMPEP_0198113028 /NCGR_PEP_ID=MMETSP1442-20131203/4787_1 /TAXON_ID= /ORGANISM="Craspedostauros australis, Strain CCMP3328" /LENGTH=585 /DNA_ID=CAMNT_0043770005 /DNA_START=435 /DNA_END=2192 /DNA_ORIENTATION=+